MNLIKNLIYFINIIIINILIIITISDSAEEPEIKLVNVIFRHGDRTPNKELYPYDPYKIYDFYPMGFGELTNKGKKRAYELGKFLRSRYGNFLNQIYTPELITARTTDYSRTKMSLELVLAGMFPPKNIQKWSTDINWQPIPYTYVPKTEDNILLPMDCPLYSEEYQRVLKTPEVIQKMTEFSEMNANLTKWTGKQISNPLDMYSLYNIFMAEWMMDLPLPGWALSVFPDGQLKDGIIYAFKVANLNTKLKRLSGGPLLTKMVENMLASKNGKLKGKKIYLYSGHETNIDSMLNVLNVYKPHIPQFSSAIILELLQTNQTYYVKVLYYTGIPPEVVELQIPDCQVLCPFDKFMEITALFRPSDEEIMCHKT
ncbi:venom acid phosphatase Acph-1-like isoform X1 [Polistes fuscatus]|uniref:venom acid phosphatase Acph-1-like isoform X1 n=2 Tax=Polistes fuscatus TaxID=30207 RepID=UPI001CA92611|nr:venom acid phosphatase Acph-1-like isoform X1 [Polistes fuscatus]